MWGHTDKAGKQRSEKLTSCITLPAKLFALRARQNSKWQLLQDWTNEKGDQFLCIHLYLLQRIPQSSLVSVLRPVVVFWWVLRVRVLECECTGTSKHIYGDVAA